MNISKSVIDIIISGMDDCISQDEIPVCAVIVGADGNVISVGKNTRQQDCNVLGHAEVNAILDAEKKIGDWRLDGYSMIVSLEPCEMCKAIIKECRLDRVYYLCRRLSNQQVVNDTDISFINTDFIDEKYISNLLTTFFNNKR